LDDIPFVNGSFKNGTNGWTIEAVPAGTGSAATSSAAARRTNKGLHLETTAGAQYIEVRQTFSVADYVPAYILGAVFWVKSASPIQVHGMLRQVNSGPNQGVVLNDRVATQTNMWERVVLTFYPPEDTTQLELIIRLEGENFSANIDEITPIRWPLSTSGGYMPFAANKFEQQLFIVDFLRASLSWPTPRTHIHNLLTSSACGLLNASGNERDNFYSLQILAGRIGSEVVRTDCNVATFEYNTYGDAYATDFNGSAPDMIDIPALSVTGTRRDSDLYLILVNRTTDRDIQTQINLAKTTVTGIGEVRTLVGTDIDVEGVSVSTNSLSVTNPLVHTVPAYSAQVLKIELDQVIDAPIVLDPDSFDRVVFMGYSLSDDTFTIASGGTDTLNYTISDDADWLNVSPDSGASTGEADSITVNYSVSGLTAGQYTATITVSSDDAYNSPQTITVNLMVDTVKPDFDRDGDVDHEDFGYLQACLSGPDVSQDDPDCQNAKLDGDSDVDQDDLTVFLECVGGPNILADPACAN
ncbi:MAG: hypothetical protein JSV03_14445, partial [Planctomycetota bacterium]